MTRTLAMPNLAMVLAALALSASSPASAQMMQEDKFSGTYSVFDTLKPTPIGRERLVVAFDETGPSVGQGFADHMKWLCWGLGDFMNSVRQKHGYCVGTDPAGDQLVRFR